MLFTLGVVSLSSCSKDDDGLGSSDSVELTGNWSGIFTYDNPVSGRKYQYFYLIINTNVFFYIIEL